MTVATVEPGQSLVTPGRTIGEGDINLFAGLVGDFTPIHVERYSPRPRHSAPVLLTGR